MGLGGLRFLYVPAADLERAREFYTDLVGLDEIHHADGLLAYDCEGFQFTIFQAERDTAPVAGSPEAGASWATQPGWQRPGTTAAISWSVELDLSSFDEAVARLQGSAGVTALHEEPTWVGYQSFPVLDPMGNTVELTCPER